MTRVIVCGDRNWTDEERIYRRLERFAPGTMVVQGEARGADSMARDVALELGLEVEGYPANWERYGRGAGPVRNQQMLDSGPVDLLLYAHDDLANSKGTADMVRRARAAGIPVERIK